MTVTAIEVSCTCCWAHEVVSDIRDASIKQIEPDHPLVVLGGFSHRGWQRYASLCEPCVKAAADAAYMALLVREPDAGPDAIEDGDAPQAEACPRCNAEPAILRRAAVLLLLFIAGMLVLAMVTECIGGGR